MSPPVRYVGLAVVTLVAAACVAAAGATLSLSPVPYAALVVVGALATLRVVAVSDAEWTMAFAFSPVWVLALLLGPSLELALGFLLGGGGGLVSLPLIGRIDGADGVTG